MLHRQIAGSTRFWLHTAYIDVQFLRYEKLTLRPTNGFMGDSAFNG